LGECTSGLSQGTYLFVPRHLVGLEALCLIPVVAGWGYIIDNASWRGKIGLRILFAVLSVSILTRYLYWLLPI
jgi:hypothetical protein